MNHYFYDFEIYNSPNTDFPASASIGKNEKKLLIVLQNEDISEENKSFLEKILSAVKYNLDNDAQRLTIQKNEAIGINEILKKNEANDIVIFGINPKKLGLSFETILYKPSIISKKTFLVCHSLEQIKKSQDLKKALWIALQGVFLKNES